jgi:hypothetical protein
LTAHLPGTPLVPFPPNARVISRNEEAAFDTSNLPGLEITPGAARAATSFNLGAMIAALGPYASLPIFYVDYGDGTGFGSSGDLKTLGSFPTSHVYVNPGTTPSPVTPVRRAGPRAPPPRSRSSLRRKNPQR